MRTTSPQILSKARMTQNLISDVITLTNTFGYYVQAVWSGSPVGTLTLEVTHDPDSGNWDVIADSAVAVSGNGSFSWNLRSEFYPYARLVYSFSSGFGAVTVNVFTKGI